MGSSNPPPTLRAAWRRGGWAGPSPGTGCRNQAATTAHMAVLHDGVPRYDDARKGQLA